MNGALIRKRASELAHRQWWSIAGILLGYALLRAMVTTLLSLTGWNAVVCSALALVCNVALYPLQVGLAARWLYIWNGGEGQCSVFAWYLFRDKLAAALSAGLVVSALSTLLNWGERLVKQVSPELSGVVVLLFALLAVALPIVSMWIQLRLFLLPYLLAEGAVRPTRELFRQSLEKTKGRVRGLFAFGLRSGWYLMALIILIGWIALRVDAHIRTLDFERMHALLELQTDQVASGVRQAIDPALQQMANGVYPRSFLQEHMPVLTSGTAVLVTLASPSFQISLAGYASVLLGHLPPRPAGKSKKKKKK